MKTFCLLLVMAAFLVGAFLSVLDPVTVNWTWLAPVLSVGALGLWGYRRAVHRQASAGERVSGNMQVLAQSLDSICHNLDQLNARRDELPTYEARFDIDRLFRADLERFVDARETMIHVLGMRHYADVMSAFAAGERYLNRVWSASTDGYQDEVRMYIERAHRQFAEARALFAELQRVRVGNAAAVQRLA
jgi:hypothetical protein